MTFGSQGFFGYGATSSSKTSQTQTEPGPEAVWWSTYSIKTLPDTRNFDKDDIHRQLQARHASWTDPVIRGIVADANIDSIYPTWTTPTLPTWGNHGMVLIGDAAHALQPSSGQGTSQALEDAQALCMLLSHYVVQSPGPEKAIESTIKAYFSLREPRVRRIADRAKYSGDRKRKKSFLGEWLTYLFVWLIGQSLFSPFCMSLLISWDAFTDLDFLLAPQLNGLGIASRLLFLIIIILKRYKGSLIRRLTRPFPELLSEAVYNSPLFRKKQFIIFPNSL